MNMKIRNSKTKTLNLRFYQSICWSENNFWGKKLVLIKFKSNCLIVIKKKKSKNTNLVSAFHVTSSEHL